MLLDSKGSIGEVQRVGLDEVLNEEEVGVLPKIDKMSETITITMFRGTEVEGITNLLGMFRMENAKNVV